MTTQDSVQVWILHPDGHNTSGQATSIEHAVTQYIGPCLFRAWDNVDVTGSAFGDYGERKQSTSMQFDAKPHPSHWFVNPVYNTDEVRKRTERETTSTPSSPTSADEQHFVVYLVHADGDFFQHLEINVLATRILIDQDQLVPLSRSPCNWSSAEIERSCVHGPCVFLKYVCDGNSVDHDQKPLVLANLTRADFDRIFPAFFDTSSKSPVKRLLHAYQQQQQRDFTCSVLHDLKLIDHYPCTQLKDVIQDLQTGADSSHSSFQMAQHLIRLRDEKLQRYKTRIRWILNAIQPQRAGKTANNHAVTRARACLLGVYLQHLYPQLYE